MIEMTNGLASVADPKRRVLRPGDAAELDAAYEARLVAGGFARYLVAPLPQERTETAENVPETAENAPEEAENVIGAAENVPEAAAIDPEGATDGASGAPEEGEIIPGGQEGGIAAELPPGGSAGTAPGIPAHDELAAMKRQELEALAAEWGVPCRVGATNASIIEALEALAAVQPPELGALGAGE